MSYLEYLNKKRKGRETRTLSEASEAEDTEEEESELDFSDIATDRPSVKSIDHDTKHPLINNMFYAGLRSACREAAYYCHRLIIRKK